MARRRSAALLYVGFREVETMEHPDTASGGTGSPARARAAQDPPRLSPREGEVLRLRADGWSAAQIAHDLSISTNTVRTRSRRVLAKLGTHEWREAALRARELGIL